MLTLPRSPVITLEVNTDDSSRLTESVRVIIIYVMYLSALNMRPDSDWFFLIHYQFLTELMIQCNELQILCAHLHAQSEQKPIKILGKVAMGVVRDEHFQGTHPIHRAHRAVIFDSSAFLFCTYYCVLCMAR